MLLVCLSHASSSLFSFENLRTYAKVLRVDRLLANETGNELWQGLLRDCDRSVGFSCIQKNAYSYLDSTFVERGNITVFEGLTLTKNNLDYRTCRRKDDQDTLNENLVEDSSKDDCTEEESDEEGEKGREIDEEQSPLEEVTNVLRKKAVKFLATRDYEIQLPEVFFESAAVKISPKEVDENGALVRVDFGQRGLSGQGRIFKKISTNLRAPYALNFIRSFWNYYPHGPHST